jgi:hypothetical protein
MRKKRAAEEANISFLDVICCGFGGIVLLLLIVQTQVPDILEVSDTDASGRVKALQEQLFDIRGEINYLERELTAKNEQIDVQEERVAILRGERDQLGRQAAALTDANLSISNERRDLQLALQSLTIEMRALYQDYEITEDYIGGIPVDSEYVIFIVDTSGSMKTYAWNRLVTEVNNILDIYPTVKGMQIMNDMGEYMFRTYRDQWIPDTPSRRSVIMSQLRTWQPFSNSSPVEGINSAIRSFYSADKKISLYVMGDDYSGRTLERVLETVRQLNRQGSAGEPMVRIHAIGFPIFFFATGVDQMSAVRYAALMREMTHQNLGTFVGLNDYR